MDQNKKNQNLATITVKDKERLKQIGEASRGHRGIVAKELLSLVADSKGAPVTKQAVIDRCAPLIEATPQKTVQGGDYVTRYYLSELTGQGILSVVKPPKAEPVAKAADASKPPKPADRQQAARKTA